MRHRHVAVLAVSALALVAAGRPMPEAGAAGPRTHDLPEQARQIRPDVYDLGTTRGPGGEVRRGVAWVEHAGDGAGRAGRPDAAKGGNGKGKGGGDTVAGECFTHSRQGTSWQVPEDFLIDPTNHSGMTAQEVEFHLEQAVATWEEQVERDILGDGVLVESGTLEAGTENGVNEIVFADLEPAGWVAVNYAWAVVKGRADRLGIYEFDQVYDDTGAAYSPTPVGPDAGGDGGEYSTAGIMAHEFGHAIGLGHPSEDDCNGDVAWMEAQTMHRYVYRGDTSKDDLADGDITGAQGLYGVAATAP